MTTTPTHGLICSGVINVKDDVAYACWPGTLGCERIDEYLEIIYLTWRYRVQLSGAENKFNNNYIVERDDRPVELTSGRTRGNTRAAVQKADSAAAVASASSSEPPQPSPIVAATNSDPTLSPESTRFSSGCRILIEYEMGEKKDLKEFAAWVGAHHESTDCWTIWFDTGEIDFEFDPSEGGWRHEPPSTNDFGTYHFQSRSMTWPAPPPLPPPTDRPLPVQQWCFCDARCFFGFDEIVHRGEPTRKWLGCHVCGHWYHSSCVKKQQRVSQIVKTLGTFTCIDCCQV